MDLTVAICMYNAEKYVEETLGCLMRQTRQDFRLLIVNDASTDSSPKIVEEFCKKNPRQYELVNLPENKGIGYGRHFAERHAQTKYLMFVDADDLIAEDAVEKMYSKIISDPDLMAVGCHLAFIDKNGKKMGGGIFLGETTKEGFYDKASRKKLIFMQPTAVYDRETALRVGGYNIDGFPEGKPRYQDFCEDLDLWTRMSDLYSEKKAIIVIPEVLCKYRKGEGLSSNSFPMLIKMKYVKHNLLRRRSGQMDLSFIDFYNSLSPDELEQLKKDAKAADQLRIGYNNIRKGNFIKGISSIFISFKTKPSYIVDKIKHNILRKK